MTKKIFNVTGMDCASCAMNIEIFLKKMDGVVKVNVNFAAGKAAVDFDEKKVDERKIVQAIEKLGYKVISADVEEMQNMPGHDHEKMMREQELKTLKEKFSPGSF